MLSWGKGVLLLLLRQDVVSYMPDLLFALA